MKKTIVVRKNLLKKLAVLQTVFVYTEFFIK